MILVSACLLGINCKYDGKNNLNKKVINYIKEKNVIPICPEQLGGLPTPRPASEIKNNKIYNNKNKDVTDFFNKGAEECLKLAKLFTCDIAVLKSRSPSCGFGIIYDGTFSGNLIKGNGITANLLFKNEITILTEKDL